MILTIDYENNIDNIIKYKELSILFGNRKPVIHSTLAGDLNFRHNLRGDEQDGIRSYNLVNIAINLRDPLAALLRAIYHGERRNFDRAEYCLEMARLFSLLNVYNKESFEQVYNDYRNRILVMMMG